MALSGELHQIAPWVTSSLAVGAIVATLFWKADDLISDQGRAKLSSVMAGVTDSDPEATQQQIAHFLSEFLPPPPRTAIYARNVALASLAAMVAVGVVYFTKVGGFWEQFEAGPDNTWNFLFQLLVDGCLKVFLVNYIALLPHRFYVAQLPRAGVITCIGLLVLDVAFRLLLFGAVSAVIWYGFVRLGGAFGGSYADALRSLPGTFAYAARFADLTGVYLYAAALSSLPLFMAVFLRLLTAVPLLGKAIGQVFFWLPLRDKPVRLASLALALACGTFSLIASALIRPVAGIHLS